MEDAISLYNKALELKEDSVIRDKIRDTESEKETVEEFESALDTFKEIDKYYLQESDYTSPQTSPQKIEEAVNKMRTAVDKVEELDDTKDTEISTFIKGFNETSGISVINEYVKSDFTEDGETMEGLSFISEEFQELNEMNALSFDFMGSYITKIAETEIPKKYLDN